MGSISVYTNFTKYNQTRLSEGDTVWIVVEKAPSLRAPVEAIIVEYEESSDTYKLEINIKRDRWVLGSIPREACFAVESFAVAFAQVQ